MAVRHTSVTWTLHFRKARFANASLGHKGHFLSASENASFDHCVNLPKKSVIWTNKIVEKLVKFWIPANLKTEWRVWTSDALAKWRFFGGSKGVILLAKEHIGKVTLFWPSDGFSGADFLYVPTVPYKLPFLKIEWLIIISRTFEINDSK